MDQQPLEVRREEHHSEFNIRIPSETLYNTYDQFIKLPVDTDHYSIRYVFHPNNDPFGWWKYYGRVAEELTGFEAVKLTVRIQRVPWEYRFHFDAQHNFYLNVAGKRRVTFLPFEVGERLRTQNITIQQAEADSEVQIRKMVFVLDEGDVLSIPYGWYHHFESHPRNVIDPIVGISVALNQPITKHHQNILNRWLEAYPGRKSETLRGFDQYGGKHQYGDRGNHRQMMGDNHIR